MSNAPFFVSLRWKLSLLFGGVFLLMHSLFSYFAYQHATEDFDATLRNEHLNHINMARALTDDSFMVLEQLAEMLPLLGEPPPLDKNRQAVSFATLDEKWTQWQLSWGIENLVFFDPRGAKVKSWGNPSLPDPTSASKALSSEMPEHRIVCTDTCFQQVVVPIIGKTQTAGAYGITRSFADIMIKYRRATGSDIGILFPDDALRETPGHPWPYRLAGLTLLDNNKKLYEHIARQVSLAELLEHNQTIYLQGATYEVGLTPVQDNGNPERLFLFIEDITALDKRLHEDIQKIWLYGVVSLLGSLLLLPLLLHYTFSRVSALSKALPLLAGHQYQQFRERIATKNTTTSDFDELDQLHQTALTLALHLEALEQEVRINTLKLIEKSRELATERDFVRQLIDTAPIIILTQKLNGIILTINQTGSQELGREEHSLKGKIFDLLIPESEWSHHKKLSQLRAGEITGQLQVEGQLISESGKTRSISWLHTLFNPSNNPEEAVVLTIGVDNSERTLYEQKILTMSINDPVTGLPGHQQFRDELAVALASARRYDHLLAVFLFDVDHYQEIIDTHGQRAGEMMLAWVARRLKDDLRADDRLSRITDNVFALLVSHAKTDDLAAIALKLDQIIQASPFHHAGTSYPLGTHIGISVYPEHGLTPNDLYANADAARLQAKIAGPGSFHCWQLNKEGRLKIERMLSSRHRLEQAIAQDQFVLQYQPVLHGKSSELHHHECLLRLPQDDGPLLLPETFLHHAEELGLAGKIDRIALKKALQTLHDAGRQDKDCRLSLNLSGKILEDAGFYDDAVYLFGHYGISPAKIIFEIPEAATEAHYAQAEVLIEQFKTLGCGVALDNFGVSFSSFYYLKHLPIDYVKIGGTLIRQIDQNQEDLMFVKALAGVAHTFGKLTVAKCVENDGVRKTLKALNIDLVQGSLIGKPESRI
ncbi:EAL domain-containing protein [Methylomicrobium lacus]|uniref:bifunctional diguanylate cyclase/phosphodiesterase n=1 Tax=Methylomicrobium lacus TaxID=136992 RepID=UPI0035A93D20